MADVSADIKDWSIIPSSNQPADATTIGAGMADNFQQIQATVRAAFAHKGSDLNSAATIDLGANTGFYHDIVGATGPITSFGTVGAGVWKILQFDSTPTITHNATSMILPGGASYAAAAGDHLMAMSLGGGNWIVPWTSRGTGSSAEGLRLTDFSGSDKTGATDNTAALILCMNAAFASATLTTNLVINIPDGEYLFTQNNPFGQWNVATDARQHVTIRGNGRYSTRIRFKPGGSTDAFLYDGSTGDGATAADNQLLFVMFKDIGFIMDETGMSGGTLNIVRQCPKTGTPNQNFQFRDCYALGPSTVARAGTWMFLRGTFNAAENSWWNCRASQMKTIIDSTNTQAVNQYIFGCDWESMVGDIYKFVDGGGQLTHVGGSIIYGSTLTTDGYVLNVQGSGGQGTNFNFIGIKTELNDPGAKIVNLLGTNNEAIVKFSGCDFAANTDTKTIVSVQPNSPGRVIFEDCNLNPIAGAFEYEFKDGAFAYWHSIQYNGVIEFRTCSVPPDFFSSLSWGTDAVGLYRVRGAKTSDIWNGTDPQIAWEADLTNLGQVHPASTSGAELKSVTGFVTYWPSSTENTNGPASRIQLPVDSMIRSIRVRKRAPGGSSASYRLAAINDDGTWTYGFSTVGDSGAQHDIDVTPWRQATSGVNQIVRLCCVKELAYNTQTANFTVGATLTDAGTATTAKILADTDAGATGTLTVGLITGGTGLFGVGNIISDGSGGSATAGATTSRQGDQSLTMAAGDIYMVEYL